MVVVSDSATELMVRTVDAQERTEERVMAKARIRGAARTVASAMDKTFMVIFYELSSCRTQRSLALRWQKEKKQGADGRSRHVSFKETSKTTLSP